MNRTLPVALMLAVACCLGTAACSSPAAPEQPDLSRVPDETPQRDSGNPPEPPAALRIVAPHRVPEGVPVPVVIEVLDDQNQPLRFFSEPLALTGTGPAALDVTVRLYHGRGSTRLVDLAPGTWEWRVNHGELTTSLTVEVELLANPRQVEGVLAGSDLLWGPNEVVVLSGNASVPAGAALAIAPGTVVLGMGGANLVVEGSLDCTGEVATPVLFAPAGATAWGGLRVVGGTADMVHTLVTGGGGDSTWQFGHSHSQPVCYVEDGELSLERVAFLDNVGKALGAKHATLTMLDSLVARSDTGGEFDSSQVSIRDSHILEIPSADGLPVDDDNDGFYFRKPPAGLPNETAGATVTRCVFAVGKDDAIDHNGARLAVTDTLIEGFHHEGIACSNGGWVVVENVLVRDCQQGIEAGYGAPEVTVRHSAVTGNEVGFRLGDSYEQAVEGTLTVADSVAAYNHEHNVWNYSRADRGPLAEQIHISTSMVDDPAWDGQFGNLPGQPEFGPDYRLLPGSTGCQAASDGLDLGLLP